MTNSILIKHSNLPNDSESWELPKTPNNGPALLREARVYDRMSENHIIRVLTTHVRNCISVTTCRIMTCSLWFESQGREPCNLPHMVMGKGFQEINITITNDIDPAKPNPHRYTVSPSFSRIDLLVEWRSSPWNSCAWFVLLSQMVQSMFLKFFCVRSWLTPITPRRCSRHHTCGYSSRPSRIPVNKGTCQHLFVETVIGPICLHGLLCPTIIGHSSRLN